MAAKTTGDMVAHMGGWRAMVDKFKKSPFYGHFVKQKIEKPFNGQSE